MSDINTIKLLKPFYHVPIRKHTLLVDRLFRILQPYIIYTILTLCFFPVKVRQKKHRF